MTFEYEDPCTPADLYRIDVETRQVTQLTFSNPPALAALGLVSPELVRYRSFDGLEIPIDPLPAQEAEWRGDPLPARRADVTVHA